MGRTSKRFINIVKIIIKKKSEKVHICRLKNVSQSSDEHHIHSKDAKLLQVFGRDMQDKIQWNSFISRSYQSQSCFAGLEPYPTC